VLGDPTTASADEGRRLWEALLDDARGRLGRWRPGEDGMLR
jgi:creatinine amidohydrolase/Fe(II)-dependent formamide hydrolase-like protein